MIGIRLLAEKGGDYIFLIKPEKGGSQITGQKPRPARNSHWKLLCYVCDVACRLKLSADTTVKLAVNCAIVPIAFSKLTGLVEACCTKFIIESDVVESGSSVMFEEISLIAAAAALHFLSKISGAVENVMTLHRNYKGIILTTSYKQVNFIKENISEINKRRLLQTDPEIPRDEVITKHVNSTAPGQIKLP